MKSTGVAAKQAGFFFLNFKCGCSKIWCVELWHFPQHRRLSSSKNSAIWEKLTTVGYFDRIYLSPSALCTSVFGPFSQIFAFLYPQMCHSRDKDPAPESWAGLIPKEELHQVGVRSQGFPSVRVIGREEDIDPGDETTLTFCPVLQLDAELGWGVRRDVLKIKFTRRATINQYQH